VNAAPVTGGGAIVRRFGSFTCVRLPSLRCLTSVRLRPGCDKRRKRSVCPRFSPGFPQPLPVQVVERELRTRSRGWSAGSPASSNGTAPARRTPTRLYGAEQLASAHQESAEPRAAGTGPPPSSDTCRYPVTPLTARRSAQDSRPRWGEPETCATADARRVSTQHECLRHARGAPPFR
jgi:hypothetical protein